MVDPGIPFIFSPSAPRHWSSWGDASGKLPTELRVLLAGPELEPGGYTGCSCNENDAGETSISQKRKMFNVGIAMISNVINHPAFVTIFMGGIPTIKNG